VAMVVPVLITSCHVSLKPKIGPVIAQVTTMSTATTKARGCPVACAVPLAKRANGELRYGSIMALLHTKSHAYGGREDYDPRRNPAVRTGVRYRARGSADALSNDHLGCDPLNVHREMEPFARG